MIMKVNNNYHLYNSIAIQFYFIYVLRSYNNDSNDLAFERGVNYYYPVVYVKHNKHIHIIKNPCYIFCINKCVRIG